MLSGGSWCTVKRRAWNLLFQAWVDGVLADDGVAVQRRAADVWCQAGVRNVGNDSSCAGESWFFLGGSVAAANVQVLDCGDITVILICLLNLWVFLLPAGAVLLSDYLWQSIILLLDLLQLQPLLPSLAIFLLQHLLTSHRVTMVMKILIAQLRAQTLAQTIWSISFVLLVVFQAWVHMTHNFHQLTVV